MERISYTIQITEDNQERYLLSIDYENETYEKLIDASNFSSSYILLFDLEKAIMEGLQLNRTREFPNLEIITILDKKKVDVSCHQEHLILILDCNICTRTRKRRKEIFTFALYKKKSKTSGTTTPSVCNKSSQHSGSSGSSQSLQKTHTDSQNIPYTQQPTMTRSFNPHYNIIPNIQPASAPAPAPTSQLPSVPNPANASCNLPKPHQNPNSAFTQNISQVIRNIFVSIDFIKKEIIVEEVDRETGNLSAIPLLTAGKFEMEFFVFLLHKNTDMFSFYSTPHTSFANLQEYAIKKISELFDSLKIHELILNYYNKKYYIYFSKILRNGSQIWINYDTQMNPRGSEYIVSRNMQEFVFQKQGPEKRMKFWQEIEFRNPTKDLPKLFLSNQGIKNFREKTSDEKMFLKDTISGKLFQLDDSGKITPPLTVNIFTNAGISLQYPKDLNPMTSRYLAHGQAITLLQKKSKPPTEFFYLLESSDSSSN